MTTAISEITGQPVDTWGEDWRLECEIRYVLNLPHREARNDYLRLVAKHRGQEAADLLQSQADALFYKRRAAG